MDFTKKEQKLLKYIERHGTNLHLYVISLIAVFLSMVVGTVLGIRGILNIVDIYHLVFVCTLFLMLCAISHFRVAVGIIEKYQKKINELGVK